MATCKLQTNSGEKKICYVASRRKRKEKNLKERETIWKKNSSKIYRTKIPRKHGFQLSCKNQQHPSSKYKHLQVCLNEYSYMKIFECARMMEAILLWTHDEERYCTDRREKDRGKESDNKFIEKNSDIG